MLAAGVDGFWPDEGERLPPESKLARIRMYHEGPRLDDPGQRMIALFRSGMEQGATERSLYLPRGTWYDFWTNEPVSGGREIVRPVDLETIPLYVRAGAILPMGPFEQYTAEKPNDPLTVTVYPGSNGTFTMVEDDGTGVEPPAGDRMTLIFRWADAQRELSMMLAQGSRVLEPRTRTVRVLLAGQSEAEARNVAFTGTPQRVRFE